MSKKVIFIGGTSYSGSTFIDMIIGNDIKGFSCGEIIPFFYPSQKHHFNPRCGCGSPQCTIWGSVLRNGITNIYQSIFAMFPDICFIVDSSKNPFWIESQSRYLRSQGVQTKNVIIWKTPIEFADSCEKRGRKNWRKSWVDYHRKYLSLVDDAIAIKYNSFVNDQYGRVLKRLCEYLDIQYHDKKHEYWRKKHHILFGNSSARFHLYEKDSNDYQRLSESLQREQSGSSEHKAISYKEVSDPSLIKEMKIALKEDMDLQLILESLEIFDEEGITIIRKKNEKVAYRREHLFIKRIKYKLYNAFHRQKINGT